MIIGCNFAPVHKTHQALAQILFARMRHDINRFVDEVYTPYQIQKAMGHQQEMTTSTDPEDHKRLLFRAIRAAVKSNSSPRLLTGPLKGMGTMVQAIQEDVEAMRRELLDPLNAQEAEVIESINRVCQQLDYANSIVNGHPSSVGKVHETQAELLNAIGIWHEPGASSAQATD